MREERCLDLGIVLFRRGLKCEAGRNTSVLSIDVSSESNVRIHITARIPSPKK
jgi:hypothetical protein